MQIKTVLAVFMATLVSAAAVPEGTVALQARYPANNKKAGKVNAAANNGTAAGGNVNGTADFGKCKPTMSFKTGRPGRKATEGTFLPDDELVAKGQQDALNPNIITNRICDQLTNVCSANAAAKTQCAAAKAMVSSLGTKDSSTADAFNKALGF